MLHPWRYHGGAVGDTPTQLSAFESTRPREVTFWLYSIPGLGAAVEAKEYPMSDALVRTLYRNTEAGTKQALDAPSALPEDPMSMASLQAPMSPRSTMQRVLRM